jgi:hypothetical protein
VWRKGRRPLAPEWLRLSGGELRSLQTLRCRRRDGRHHPERDEVPKNLLDSDLKSTAYSGNKHERPAGAGFSSGRWVRLEERPQGSRDETFVGRLSFQGQHKEGAW